MDLDVTRAAETDDLSQTVDYERVYTIVREAVTGKKHYLIERIGHEIAHAVMDAAPGVEGVEVTVRKPNPPVGGPCDRAEVVYRTRREG
jgi:dihydroneopterin aldolase